MLELEIERKQNLPIVQTTAAEEAAHKEKESVDATVPRFCRLRRAKSQYLYGFDFETLRTEGRHRVMNVMLDQPGYRAGLRSGDFILEVNGVDISGIAEHEQVIGMIVANQCTVDLLVVTD
jgi:C-terminal processing protease CtpA/Prc